MKNSKRNRKNQKLRAAKLRAGKPTGKSKYALKKAKRRAGIANPNSPIQPN